MTDTTSNTSNNFIAKIIQEDLDAGRVQSVQTRFPPEPNGYLHVGHAKSICLNFGVAEQFDGACNLRFDDTNPEKESQEFIDAIKDDITWLGYQWKGDIHYASDYFDQLHDWAVELIKADKAYVCDLNAEEAREYRGTLTEPGKNSPYRERTVEENLDLFARMKAGEFDTGAKVLRAKIDMASPNMNMRDPIIYRIRKITHHQTGDKWCIYPTYDFTHGQSDAIEGITHSVCTLEFEDHRPLYEWFIENLPVPAQPKQYEFGRLNLDYTVTSKRKLKFLVDEGVVAGWDDPRMPTISGMRRRGFTPSSIRTFCDMIGVTRSDGMVDVAMLEHALRSDLNQNAPRAMAVLKPLKVVIENLPEDHKEMLKAPFHPELDLGEREMPFTREIFIDQDDFKEEYSKKFKKKFCPGKRIRLRFSYVIEATDYEKDADGNVTLVKAKLIENTLGENPEDGVNPKGVVHWVSATDHKEAELRLYERLFTSATPDKGEGDFMDHVNKDSLSVVTALIEPALAEADAEANFQFEREGYYVADRFDHTAEKPIFNLTIGLREDKALLG
ncbi:glutamine--tRNA ligase/YqeY domain fusion protein [Thalassolituus sp. UBA3500]|uniref:glutamine--tRNA ligase/YqeY domain fusion protein n=1 Tax=Thalassolituus sp. UBA3500 TaxID=1947664 RepID=UPI000C115A47|nr:glutamine--tRNA ligase/YqeY domain fusion protein [Thalassolituus sp. UBA3500]MBN59493.1 glutamine--tRNA ligase [Oceanospirillaceae bacterium]|tara:strand:+ start:8561 stop:10231 length:1671 start_codon:yes stop_codon:yes gene_type:complete